MARPMPALAGNSCPAPFSAACYVSPRAGGPGLLEYQGCRPTLAEGHRPSPNGVGSRSNASAVADDVLPWASSKMAYHRSRSRGVGAQIIRRRRSLVSACAFHLGFGLGSVGLFSSHSPSSIAVLPTLFWPEIKFRRASGWTVKSSKQRKFSMANEVYIALSLYDYLGSVVKLSR